MPQYDADDEWEDDDDWEPDADEEPTIECPHCGVEIHEDAQRCPQCGAYLSEEDSPSVRPPWWIIAGAALGLYAVWRWIAG